MVRTRFAPSPTGYMHLGNLRSALYTFLFARANNGKFILRIEDTDRERYVEGAVDVIYRTLKSIGMDWDEGPDIGGDYGPYVQSERKDLYLPYAKELVKKKKAYYCFCTEEELQQRRDEAAARGETFKYDKHCLHLSEEEIQARLDAGMPYVIRQNVPEHGEASFDDVLYGHIAVDCSDLDDMILIKADGMPTYNFANVIDDHTMGITHVMRGNEYLSSTPKYNLLYDAFGWEKPVYIHMTPIMRDATHKLSKRDGDAYFEDYINKGYLKEAIVNYVALLGWNPGDEREFFTIDELIAFYRCYNSRIYNSMANSAEFGDHVVWAARDLVRDIIDRADAALREGSATAADLRFGHDSGILPLAGLMDLVGPGDRLHNADASDSWQSFFEVPMGTNLQMVFYRKRGAEPLVKIWYNERETQVRGLQPVSGNCYRWTDLRAHLERRIAQFDF